MNERQDKWDASFERRENFVFVPSEHLVRFVSKYIRKRIGLGEFKDVMKFNPPPKLLDLGCGIGRHVIFGQEMGIDSFGVDLSPVAIETARKWAAKCGISNPDKRLLVGSVTDLQFEDGYF